MQSLQLQMSAYCDDITVTFSDIIAFSDVNLSDGVCNLLYNQCISNK